MIEKLSPYIRKLLVEYRCMAMRGDISAAISQLENIVNSLPDTSPALDMVALLMLKAEMLYLDFCYEEALKVFEAIAPYLGILSHDEQVVIEDNKNCIMLRGIHHDATSSFYYLYDERKLAGIKMRDERSIIVAHDATIEGKHYEALPGYWRQLIHSYNVGYWRAFMWASKTMGMEYFALGLLDKAAHHAIIAEDKNLLVNIGKTLLLKRNPELIGQTIQKLLDNANLQQHAANACLLIAEIGDAIPKEYINSVFQWIMRWANINPSNWWEMPTLNNAWDAIKSIAPQLAADQSRHVIGTAINHEVWKIAHKSREHLIEAVHSCLLTLPDEDLPDLASKTVPLVTDVKSDLDYVSAVNLLCGIASRADANLKTTLADALYPPDAGATNFVLLQVAPIFGKQVAIPEKIAKWADEIAQRLYQQVQRLESDQEPVKVPGSIMTITNTKDGVKVVTTLQNSYDLSALVKHRHLLGLDSLEKVVQAILIMANDEDNILDNRSMLIHLLGEFADLLSENLAEEVLMKLSPLANGSITVSSTLGDEFNADNPLNPFKVRMGNTNQVRGAALHALAMIEKAQPKIYGEKLYPIFENALTSEDITIRLWGFMAAGMLPKLSKPSLTAVLFGMRDPDPIAAGWALHAVVDKPDLCLEEEHLHALIYSLTMAIQSPDVSLRRAAAVVIKKLRNWSLDENLKGRVSRLNDTLAHDISYSVRNALNGDTSDSEP